LINCWFCNTWEQGNLHAGAALQVLPPAYRNLALTGIHVHNAFPAILLLLIVQGPAPDDHLQFPETLSIAGACSAS
jgi:hypothetical protein